MNCFKLFKDEIDFYCRYYSGNFNGNKLERFFVLTIINLSENGFKKMNEQRLFILIALAIVIIFVSAALLIAKIGIFLEKSFFN